MQSKGEYRVGVSFNPSGNETVDKIKKKTAELIDLIDSIPLKSADTHAQVVQQGEVNRLKALAMTSAEESAMWAVKAATKPEVQ